MESKNILLVEDEVLIAVDEARMLRKEGYEVVMAVSGKEAIAKVEAAPGEIALILMDIDLGKNQMDGTQAAQEILAKHDIPILFLSSHTERDIVEKTEKITSYGYVLKGSSVTVLAASIKMAFKLHAAHQALQQEVAERKRAEKALKESEEKHRSLVQNLHAGVVVHAPDTHILLANEQAAILLGLTIDQMMGKTAIDPAWSFLRDDKSPMPLEEYPVNQVIDTRMPLNNQVLGINRPATNDIAWVQISAFPEFDTLGNLMQVVVTFVDITERKLAEETLRKSEEKFSKVFQHSPLMMAISDVTTGMILDVNQQHINVSGYTRDEWLKNTSLQLDWISPQERARLLAKLRTQGYLQDEEFTVRSKGGRLIPVIYSGFFIEINGKNHIVSISQDVTERKLAEETLKMHSLILQNIDEGVNMVRIEDNSIVYANPTLEKMFGYDPDELLGKPVSILNAPDQENQEETARRINEALQKNGVWNGELQNVRKNGEIFWCLANVTVFTHPQFGPLGVSVHQDITERKRTEDELLHAKSYAENLISTANAMIVGLDVAGNLKVFNQTTEKITGYTQAELQGKNWFDEIVPKERYPHVWEEFTRLLEGGMAHVFENPILTKTGEERHIVWQSNELREKSEIIGTLSFGIDVTEHRRAEEQIQNLAKFPSENPSPVLRIAQNGALLYINESGISQLASLRLEKNQPVPPVLREAVFNAMQDKAMQTLDIECAGRLYSFFITPVPLAGYANLYGRDITDKKRAEAALHQALVDKDMLMSELQHRVKNSLNIVAGLLSMEENNLPDAHSQAILSDLRSRIQSISLVYEQLYLHNTIDQVDLQNYIQDLCDKLSQAYTHQGGIETRLDTLQIDTKRALALGIIVNELVTNALKYAIPAPGQPCIIRVELEQSGNKLRLSVTDNGISNPAGKQQTSGTGLELVKLLTRQINGSFELETRTGYTAQVFFPAT